MKCFDAIMKGRPASTAIQAVIIGQRFYEYNTIGYFITPPKIAPFNGLSLALAFMCSALGQIDGRRRVWVVCCLVVGGYMGLCRLAFE